MAEQPGLTETNLRHFQPSLIQPMPPVSISSGDGDEEAGANAVKSPEERVTRLKAWVYNAMQTLVGLGEDGIRILEADELVIAGPGVVQLRDGATGGTLEGREDDGERDNKNKKGSKRKRETADLDDPAYWEEKLRYLEAKCKPLSHARRKLRRLAPEAEVLAEDAARADAEAQAAKGCGYAHAGAVFEGQAQGRGPGSSTAAFLASSYVKTHEQLSQYRPEAPIHTIERPKMTMRRRAYEWYEHLCIERERREEEMQREERRWVEERQRQEIWEQRRREIAEEREEAERVEQSKLLWREKRGRVERWLAGLPTSATAAALARFSTSTAATAVPPIAPSSSIVEITPAEFSSLRSPEQGRQGRQDQLAQLGRQADQSRLSQALPSVEVPAVGGAPAVKPASAVSRTDANLAELHQQQEQQHSQGPRPPQLQQTDVSLDLSATTATIDTMADATADIAPTPARPTETPHSSTSPAPEPGENVEHRAAATSPRDTPEALSKREG